MDIKNQQVSAIAAGSRSSWCQGRGKIGAWLATNSILLGWGSALRIFRIISYLFYRSGIRSTRSTQPNLGFSSCFQNNRWLSRLFSMGFRDFWSCYTIDFWATAAFYRPTRAGIEIRSFYFCCWCWAVFYCSWTASQRSTVHTTHSHDGWSA